jgi:TPR repeat protein
MNRLLILPVLLLTLLVGTPAFSADFQKGVTAYESGDYATALREWYPLAEQGSAGAQFNLGVMYEKGQGVPQDDKTAVKYYRLAAEQGDAVAQFNLGVTYYVGQGVLQDYKTALKWYRLAAEQGYASAQYNLGWMYDNGTGVLQDYKTAVKWYRLATEQGHASAQSSLKNMKSRLVSKGIDGCLFDEIAKVTGPQTKNIVEKHCRSKMEKKSLDWLLRYAN